MTPAVVITQDGRRTVFERDDSIPHFPVTTATGKRVHAHWSDDSKTTLCGKTWTDNSYRTVDCKRCLRNVELG